MVQRGSRKIRVGKVISTKMDKTIVVEVERLVQHPKYKKTVKRTSRLYAHDEKKVCNLGDIVRVAETRPLSKRKRWRLVERLEELTE